MARWKLVCLLNIFLVSSVFASRARMTALGQGVTSHHIQDQRNALYYPHKLNTFNDFVIMEWGDDLNSIVDTDNTDSATTFGEGGFSRKLGNFIYQLYLGNDDRNTRSSNADTVSNTADTYDFLNDNNRIDFSIGGNAGFLWGLGVYWGKGSKEYNPSGSTVTKAESETLGVKLSFGNGPWSIWAISELKNEATGNIASTPSADTQRDKYESDTGNTFGGSYDIGLWTIHGEYITSGFEVNDISQSSNGVGKSETKTIRAGVGYNRKLNEVATFFGDVEYLSIENENTDVSDTKATVDEEWGGVGTFAFEVKANSWLQFRGSVSQYVIREEVDQADGSDSPKLETIGSGATTVAAGATVSFNKFKIDGTISTTSGSYNLGTGTLADVAVHYWF